jgi:hypothetical protein
MLFFFQFIAGTEKPEGRGTGSLESFTFLT